MAWVDAFRSLRFEYLPIKLAFNILFMKAFHIFKDLQPDGDIFTFINPSCYHYFTDRTKLAKITGGNCTLGVGPLTIIYHPALETSAVRY